MPEIKVYTKVIGPGVRITGLVKTEGKYEIAGVQYRFDDKMWMLCDCVDGAYDSTYENFSFIMPTYAKGKHKIEIQAIDRAGNISSIINEFEIK